MAYLLWIIIVFGCLYMGLMAISVQLQQGFALALTLNALLYLGCALYGLPRLARLLFKRS